MKSKPLILVFSAHDPTGAAGLQADIEAINQNSGRSVSVITAVTAQNTFNFESILPQSPTAFRKQLETLISDISIDGCKIGLIGSELLISEISDFLINYKNIPVVLDPILHSGTGSNVSSKEVKTSLLRKLVPKTTILTPNIEEALELTGQRNADTAAQSLLSMGCKHVLITDTEKHTKDITNILYTVNKDPIEYTWKRLPAKFHGSGCTLAASISINFALHNNIQTAVHKAQEYTWNTLKYGEQIGSTQLHPSRHF